MVKKIAIIIPAYKACFFREVLDSIVKQTNQNFTVYVGDDASPDDLEAIVADYIGKLDIVYFRYDKNLGASDLVAHWERCIRMSNEPLIWFFSDDDLIPSDGVERVLNAAEVYGEHKVVFRFPLAVVNSSSELVHSNPPLTSQRLSGYEFLLDKLSGKISSAACEYVFSRDVWMYTGGFVHFPLAWCSDDATWAKFADYAGGAISLLGQPVCWRNANDKNISNSARFDKEKLNATGHFIRWIRSNYSFYARESKLQVALELYVNTILKGSVRGNYTVKGLIGLCILLRAFGVRLAWRIFCKHFSKAKFRIHSFIF